MEGLMEIIRAIRNQRAEMNIPPSKKAKVYLSTPYGDTFRDGIPFIQRLAGASDVIIAPAQEIPVEGSVQVITDSARAFIPMAELIDRDKELARLRKEEKSCQKDIDTLTAKLNNPGFLAKAPAAVVEADKEKLQKANERMGHIRDSIQALG